MTPSSVKTHQRRTSTGRKVTVHNHTRAVARSALSNNVKAPLKAAKRSRRKAVRALQKRNYRGAAAYAGLSAVQGIGYLVLTGVSFMVQTAFVLLLSGVVAALAGESRSRRRRRRR